MTEMFGALRWCVRMAPDRRAALSISALSIVNVVTFALPGVVVARLVDDAVRRSALRPILLDLGVLAALGLVSSASGAIRAYEVLRAVELLALRLRSAALRRLLSYPLPFYAQAPTGAMVSRVTEATGQAAFGTYAALSNGLDQLLGILAAIAVLVYLDWRLALISMLVIPVVFLPSRQETSRIGAASGEVIDAATDFYSLVTERLGFDAVLLARQMNRVEDDLAAVERQSHRQWQAALKRTALQRRLTFTVGLGTSAGELGVLATAVLLVATGHASIGVVSGFILILAQLYGPLNVLSTTVGMIQAGVAATERLQILLERQPAPPAPAPAERVPEAGMDVAVDNVSYAYPRRDEVARALALDDDSLDDLRVEPTVRDLSVVVPAGSFAFIVGRSGAGKTTLVHLLAGMILPDHGSIWIGDTTTRDLSPDERARRILLVPQNPFLLRATLRDNLAYARSDASEEELLQACTAAQLRPMLDRLPAGLDTVVGERGFAVSGGERQRIAVARALLLDPEILILDEPTAHLDEQAAMSMLAAIRRARDGRTLIVVAHRIARIDDADLVVVLEHGRVCSIGRPGETEAVRGGIDAGMPEEADAL